MKLQMIPLLLGAALLAACPSEPTNSDDKPLSPAVSTTEATSSVLDEVEVMGADEAFDQAEQDITEENVLDALGELEKEIGSKP